MCMLCGQSKKKKKKIIYGEGTEKVEKQKFSEKDCWINNLHILLYIYIYIKN